MLYNSEITGETILKLRKEKALSQEVLSGLAGIPRSHLSMIETGRKSPNVETLWKLSSALDIKLSELIRMIEDSIEASTSEPAVYKEPF